MEEEMKIEEINEMVEACCRKQIPQEKEERYNYVKEAVVRWVCENYDEKQMKEISEEVLTDRVIYYSSEFNKKKYSAKGNKEWEMLEEAYRIYKEGANPEESKIAKEWRNLRPEQIMYYAMEAFGKKMIRSWNKWLDAYSVETAVAEAIVGAMERGAFGAYNEEQFIDKKNIYDSCDSKEKFCGLFRTICHRKYCDVVKKIIKDNLRNESYDFFLEKGIEAGEPEVGIDEEGGGSLSGPKTDEWTKELVSMLRLVLKEVAKGPLTDQGHTPGVHRNVGGAFAKYVPFLSEKFVKKGKRYELWTYEDRDVPEEQIEEPRAKKGATKAEVQMYPIIENHTVRSAAIMFAKIINRSMEKIDDQYDWIDSFYDRIKEYEKKHGSVMYHDVIQSDSTMGKNATSLHKEVLEKCKEDLERKIKNFVYSTPTENLLLEQLDELLSR